MHGLIICSIQNFVCDTLGRTVWADVTQRAGAGSTDFEAMLIYEDDLALRLMDAASLSTGRSCADMLEDLGTYLVSTPRLEGVRRLLRFGGVDFAEFLHSLDDLPGRARLAVSDLELPGMMLEDVGDGVFVLWCGGTVPGFGSVMMGVLRVIADDYGALVLLDHAPLDDGEGRVTITLIDAGFAEGRSFDLGAVVG
jgi:hypothetical protein